MGIDAEFSVADGDVCERWLGLAGEHVYHVHQEDDDRWSPYAGGDIIRRNIDPGRVYIWLTSPTDYWSLTALTSLIQQFPKAMRRCMTKVDGLPRLPIAMPTDPPASQDEAREAAWIDGRTKSGSQHHRVAIQVDFSDRFLAKLRLGLGHSILGSQVSSSRYADALRTMLWSRDIDVRGSGFWTGALAAVPNMLKWKGAWSVFLTSVGEGFGMAVTTPGGRFMSMMISDDPSLWPPTTDRTLLNGAVILFVPQRTRVVGPVPIIEFIAHRTGSRPRADLADLEAMRSTLASLPPKNTSSEDQQLASD